MLTFLIWDSKSTPVGTMIVGDQGDLSVGMVVFIVVEVGNVVPN